MNRAFARLNYPIYLAMQCPSELGANGGSAPAYLTSCYRQPGLGTHLLRPRFAGIMRAGRVPRFEPGAVP